MNIKLYRFGGPSLEEYMKSNPDLSRQDALRSLTSSFDDKGIQKVLYGNGGTGESVQFCALANGGPGTSGGSVRIADRFLEGMFTDFDRNGFLERGPYGTAASRTEGGA